MDYRDIDFFPGVNLIISNTCRMKCSFCCASSIDKREKIDKDKLFKLIDILHDNGTRRICFTGGEPLLCPYFEELIKYSYDKGIINTVMSSDGELVNRLKVDGKYIDTFWLSVHGLGKKHDNITNVTNSFAKLEKAFIPEAILFKFALVLPVFKLLILFDILFTLFIPLVISFTPLLKLSVILFNPLLASFVKLLIPLVKLFPKLFVF